MTSSTVLVDLRCCQFHGDRGISAYAQSLAMELASTSSNHRWLLLQDPRRPLPSRAEELAAHATWCTTAELDTPQAPAINTLLTGCFFLPDHRCGSEYLLPPWLARHQPRRLGIVYDLVPLLFPERYLARDRARRHYLETLGTLRQSDELFAISQATRRDVIRHAAVDPRRIHCIYGDIDHHKRALMAQPATASDVAPRHGLAGPYCVYVGGDDWRKNLENVVRAFALFHRDHPRHQLGIVCKLSGSRIAQLQTLAAEAGLPATAVVCTGFVSDGDLVALVRAAELLVYPSLYEGLGLPVLEAYGCNTPVVGSATSSVAELVLPELACDPNSPASIAAAMDRLVASPTLRDASLDFGRRLLATEIGWERAAAAVMERIESPSRGSAAVARGSAARTQGMPAAIGPRPPVAVVAALPPARTGIAPYTLRHLQSDHWQTTFYDAGAGPRLAAQQGLMPTSRLAPAEVFAAAALRGRHDAVIFVLGNSSHHVKVLDAMMRSRGTAPRRLAYLHEASLDSLFRAWLGPQADRLPEPSPAAPASGWIARSLAAKPGLGRHLRLLIERGELDGLIVNSAACRDLIRGAVGELVDTIPIEVVHLPVDAVATHPAVAQSAASPDEPLRIGSFGLAGDTKRLDALVQAFLLLRRRRAAELLLAGWEARSYCRRTGISSVAGVEVLDAPNDERLFAAMRCVDVAVQLRTPTFGESSGVVHQLLALGTPLVVTNEGSFAELPGDVASFVTADCMPQDLTAAIEIAATRRLSPERHSAIVAAHSSEAFAARIAEILPVASLHRERVLCPSGALSQPEAALVA